MKKMIFGLLALVLGVVGVGIIPSMVYAGGGGYYDICTEFPSDPICDRGDETAMMTTVGNVLNAIYGILGVIAVVMIVISGVKYTTSQGDPGKVQSAKNTILYAIIGLVIALLAFAITNFILNAL